MRYAGSMHVEQARGGFTEATHAVSAVALRLPPAGPPHTILDCDGGLRTFWRSAAKPFQLLAVLEALEASGHSENTPFTVRSLSDDDLAIGASSHSGSTDHLALVERILTRAGLSAGDLCCGAERPLDPDARAALGRTGSPPSPLHNDCSGKHALMLLACRARGWSTHDYIEPQHPIQQGVGHVVARVVGTRPPTAIDGCGVPTFWLTLREMALAWAHLAAVMADPDLDPLLARIGHAMSDNPLWTSGRGRLDLAVAQRTRAPFVGKIGALGVFCVAWPEARTGVAIKVHSGDEDALAVAVDAIVDACCPGALAPSPDWPWHAVHNVVGRTVGTRRLVGLPPVPSVPRGPAPPPRSAGFDMSS